MLGSGQVFGELSVLDQSKSSPVTAISYTGVELYVFEGEHLVNLGIRFNSHCVDALCESLNMHNPPSEKLNYYFRSKYAWEMRKAKLLKSITGKKQEGSEKSSDKKESSKSTSKLPTIHQNK